MCKSKADGGVRCSGTATGKALYALYRDRKANPSGSASEQIEALKSASEYYGGKFVSPLRIDLPSGVEHVLESLSKVSNPLIVGGAVRDAMRDAEIKDHDIEVYGIGVQDLVDHLEEEGFILNQVGRQFGVIKVQKPGVIDDIDISLPRRENRTGSSHRDFRVETSEDMTVVEAAERRDFTFNAMLYDHQRSILIDPFHGKEDLDQGTMQHVSDKFDEDPLRVMRGFQIAARFDMKMSQETSEVCKYLRPEADSLSSERMQEEWRKFFEKSISPAAGIKVLKDTGWDNTLPGLRESLDNEDTLSALDKLPSVPSDQRAMVGAAIVAQGTSGENRKQMLRTLLIGSKAQKSAYDLIEASESDLSTKESRHSFIANHQARHFSYHNLATYSKTRKDWDTQRDAHLAISEGIADAPEPELVTGNEVLDAVGKPPGPWLGKALKTLRAEQFAERVQTKEEALTFLKNLC